MFDFEPTATAKHRKFLPRYIDGEECASFGRESEAGGEAGDVARGRWVVAQQWGLACADACARSCKDDPFADPATC